MIQVKDISEIPETDQPIILAMGCFDGLHIGHQQVIQTAIDQAAQNNGQAWVYTFNPHPAKVLNPDRVPPLISAETCRLRKLSAMGIHGIISVPFCKEYAHITPGDFLSGLWNEIPTLAGIVCGFDWSFGHRAAGNFQFLEQQCREHGITATAVAPVLFNGERVSSTQIRKAISDGDIPLAEQLLGRPFSLFGTVTKGHGIGKKLGYPTANIDPENELLPSPGIYAGYTMIQNAGPGTSQARPIPSAIFIGERKTFDDDEHVIESHLIDFEGDLYNQPLELSLSRKIRGVHAFASTEELIEQIKIDVSEIRALLHP